MMKMSKAQRAQGMTTTHNFSAGPATLPKAVLEQAQAEMLSWNDTGCSVMELSHRGEKFRALLSETEDLLRQLMDIPANYQVLFIPGSARLQFSGLPMNLLVENPRANYLVSGYWSKLAYREATKYGQITQVASSADDHFMSVPEPETWQLDEQAEYFYYTPNETLQGVSCPFVPDVSMPLIADMTSCILSKQIDVREFGVIFAAAQKNLGQAGVTVVIIRDDLIQAPMPQTPAMMDFRRYRDSKSLCCTPPTYALYIMNLTLRYWAGQGGVLQIEALNQQKSQLLYQFIDQSDFYYNRVAPRYRSASNVTFNLPKADLEAVFLSKAQEQGLLGLKGHSAVGGLRASIYNAMPLSGVEHLIGFMQIFQKAYS